MRATTGTPNAKRARLGAKPGFSSVDAKWARGSGAAAVSSYGMLRNPGRIDQFPD